MASFSPEALMRVMTAAAASFTRSSRRRSAVKARISAVTRQVMKRSPPDCCDATSTQLAYARAADSQPQVGSRHARMAGKSEHEIQIRVGTRRAAVQYLLIEQF